MKLLNFGSLNIDYVYKVDHLIREGETQHSGQMQSFAGGKGLNQSVALAKTGMKVYHAGMIGNDGELLLTACREQGINTKYIKKIDEMSGHAVIQVDRQALNGILVYRGANGKINKEYVDHVLQDFDSGDLLILQNEISMLPYIIDRAYEKQMTIILNPSPYDESLNTCDLSKISVFIMNETEGCAIAGNMSEPTAILDMMMMKYPNAQVVLTMGADGAYYCSDKIRIFQPAFQTVAVDTTAAGDTFTGFFIRGLVKSSEIKTALEMAACAAAIAVSREGAAASIPTVDEVEVKRKTADCDR